MANKLESALALAAKGFKVFPIQQGAKFPPLLNGWPAKATSDPETVAMYWVPLPEANIGIHCEGLCVIDVDVNKGGNESLALLELIDELPPTLTTRTPTGGRHLYYRIAVDDGPGAVPNSVGTLGAGLDVRSTGGYVVAPGSTVEAGDYTWEHDKVGIAPAPDWLIERLGTPKVKASTDSGQVRIVDAPDALLERAGEWLRGAERSTKGSGGDQAAYRVAAFLRDMGCSYAQACDLMRSEAWDFGCGWREGRLEDKPIRSAYKYASGDPGSKAALPEDFPIVPDSGTTVPKIGTPEVVPLSLFANREYRSAGHVLKGLLQLASYAEVYGAPGEGKTFVALDAAYHVAAGRDWMGHKAHAGPVLYLAYEGTGGMVKRAKALIQKYGTEEVPLYIVGAAMNLRDKIGRQALGEVIALLPAKPVLIVIDTFARALMGGDENSAQDVGAFNTAIAGLISSTGACVMIIHHSGKDKSKGARGSSALLGALDTEIEVDAGHVSVRKQRDMEVAEPIGFKLTPMVVGMDEDGDETTSCTVEQTKVGTGGPGGLPRLTGNAKRGFEILCDLRPTNAPVTAAEWKDKCVEFMGTKNMAQRFYDIKRILAAKGYIVVDEDGMVTRRME